MTDNALSVFLIVYHFSEHFHLFSSFSDRLLYFHKCYSFTEQKDKDNKASLFKKTDQYKG